MAKLSAILRETEGDLVGRMRLSVTFIGGAVVTGTPVKTGRARASWNATIGMPMGRDVDPTKGMIARNNLTEVVNRLQPGDKFNFINIVPYIGRLEEGSSAQAPHGMLDRNVARWQQFVDKSGDGLL